MPNRYGHDMLTSRVLDERPIEFRSLVEVVSEREFGRFFCRVLRKKPFLRA